MTVRRRRLAISALLASTIVASAGLAGAPAFAQSSTTQAATAHPSRWPAAASPAAITDAKTEAFTSQLMARMSVEEKVGQTIQGDIASMTPADLEKYPLGSILAGGN